MSDERRPSLLERAKDAISHFAETAARGVTDDHNRQTRLERYESDVGASGDTAQSLDDNFRLGLAPGEKLDASGQRWESTTIPSSVLEGNSPPTAGERPEYGMFKRDAMQPAVSVRMTSDPSELSDVHAVPTGASASTNTTRFSDAVSAASHMATSSTTTDSSDAISAALHLGGSLGDDAPSTATSGGARDSSAPAGSQSAAEQRALFANVEPVRVNTHTSPDNTTGLGPLGFVTDHMDQTSRDKMGAWAYHQGESQSSSHGSAMPVSSDYGSMAGYDSRSQSGGGGIIDSVKHAASSLIGGVTNLTHKAEDTVESGVGSVKQGASSLVEGVANLAVKAEDTVESGVHRVGQTASSAVGEVENRAGQMYDYTKGSLEAGVDNVKHAVSTAIGTTRDAAHNVESRAEKLLDTATDKVYDAYGAVRDKSAEVLGEAKAETYSVADKARDVMHKAADTVTQGIKADHDKQLGMGDSALVMGGNVPGTKKPDPHEEHVDVMLT